MSCVCGADAWVYSSIRVYCMRCKRSKDGANEIKIKKAPKRISKYSCPICNGLHIIEVNEDDNVCLDCQGDLFHGHV